MSPLRPNFVGSRRVRRMHQHKELEQPFRKDRPVQFLRLIRRACFRIARRIAGRVKRLGRAVMDEDMIGMAVAAKGIERHDDLRLHRSE